MDIDVLKKKISTFRGDGGRVRISDDHLLMEILQAWEQWTGAGNEFYRAIGVSQTGMASIIGKAKKLRREGHFPVEEFKEIKVEAPAAAGAPSFLPSRSFAERMFESSGAASTQRTLPKLCFA